MNTNLTSINDRINSFPILNDVFAALKLRNLSHNTCRNYSVGIARFLEFIHYDNQFDITEDMFRDYLIYLNSTSLSKNTININNAYIRFFFQAVLNKPINLFLVPKAKCNHPSIDSLFDHEVIALLKETSFDSRMDCIVKLALCCGLRINEIVSLKVCDIHTSDPSQMCIFVRDSKRNKSRFVPLDNTAYRAIQRYAKEFHIQPKTMDFLFRFSNTPHTCNETIRRHFRYYLKKAGISDTYTFHCLRHTFAVNYMKSNGNLLNLKYLLGHSSLAATSIYLSYVPALSTNSHSYYDSLLGDHHAN